jgi:hypothetical protein
LIIDFKEVEFLPDIEESIVETLNMFFGIIAIFETIRIY